MKHTDNLEHEEVDRLPDPEDRPGAEVVIYDDACRLCSNAAAWLDQLDRGGRLAFLPLQDPRVRQRYPDLSPEELQKHVYVIDIRGTRHRGAGAIRHLSRRLPTLWALAPLFHLPGTMPLWRRLYSQVAKRRHAFDRKHE